MTEQNKVAVITGGGSGIGAASARALAARDFCVVLAGRRADALEQVARDIDRPDRVLTVVTDVADADGVQHLFEQAIKSFGRVDLLFNNAGTGAPPLPMEDLTLKQWQTVVNVNLTGAFLCTQQAFRAMKSQSPQGGRIINNGSISAQTPRPNSAPYTATKHAITGLTKSTALDGRPFNIACGQIDIGNAGTPMTSRMGQGVPQADGSIKPEPTMDVEHVAQAVAYMASLPLDANVLSMTVMATGMPLVGRG